MRRRAAAPRHSFIPSAKPSGKAELLEKIACWRDFLQKVSALHNSPPAQANGAGSR